MLAFSVLADSAVEHYRGSFANRAMALPLISSAVSIALNGSRLNAVGGPDTIVRKAAHVGAGLVGVAGLRFHLYNLGKQPGGYILNNFFYKAPLGAPGALIIAGGLGAVGDTLASGRDDFAGVPLRSGRVLGGAVALGIVGNVAEVALLHFRGAYHNPAMWLPIAIPPLAALSLLRDAVKDDPTGRTVFLLGATAALGLIGSAFHIYGVSRNMGGWKNWSQNLLQGPPIPAPPSFTGLALAGMGALMLMRRRTT